VKNNIIFGNSQLLETSLADGRVVISIKTNNFHAGEIHPQRDTFYSAKRTGKNVMRMFHNSLGINSQILNGYTFKFIVIPFENSILKTTRKKWISEGVVSPYSDIHVDQQILLPLDQLEHARADFKNEFRVADNIDKDISLAIDDGMKTIVADACILSELLFNLLNAETEDNLKQIMEDLKTEKTLGSEHVLV